MKPSRMLIVAALGVIATAQAQTGAPSARGELLYATHCVACHTTQMHWRDGRLATDWPGLKAQVRRWAVNAGTNWSDEDIAEVARYLNGAFYKFPVAAGTDLARAGGPAQRVAGR